MNPDPNPLQRLGELQDATEMARQERLRSEDECQRKERVYAQNVRLLQEAASHLEEKLVKKQEVCLRLFFKSSAKGDMVRGFLWAVE